MLPASNFTGRSFKPWLLACGVVMALAQQSAAAARIVPVNIFGDGDPLNGIEDDREPVRGATHGAGISNDRQLNAGTITCDGKLRGTAMVLDTREFASDFKGAVLVTAAHVLYDLDEKRLFRRCEFYFMGWKNFNGYRSRIDLKSIRTGGFDPLQTTGNPSFGEGDWAILYLRKPWKKFIPEQSLLVREFAFAQGESYQQSGGKFRLVGYDSSAGIISESVNCTVVESDRDDLGGGAWKGQLLDDCDSADGASGGGIIAVLEQRSYLIGIRSGSHWSRWVYPADRFPSGPPDGSAWDRQLNTNFGRAFDAQLLQQLGAYIQSLGE
ncbi:MAG: hypothetical protein WBS20_01030 [Lysobacterales bacterium]